MTGTSESTTAAALRALEERLERASVAAERLFAEAAATVAGRHDTTAGTEADPAPPELELLLALGRKLRELVPPELQRRLAEALHELLLAVRALIDWYLQRLESRRAAPVQVTDIPIS